MKLKIRALSAALAGVIVFNHIPVVYAAEGDKLTLTCDIVEAIDDIEYGSTAPEYRFAADILSGVESEDEVYLVADAEYDSVSAGKTNITLSGFRLDGKDAEKYIIPDIDESVKKEININKKVIKILPEKNYIYYGQEVPESICTIADYSGYIVSGDNVSISAEFVIETVADTEDEYFIRMEDTVVIDNDNYTVELADDKFEVREYIPEAECKICIKDYKGVIKAPDGYLISRHNEKDSEWAESIEFDLEKTNNGSVTYYLRCNNSSVGAFYQAISTEFVYEYELLQILPEIKSINVEKVDTDSILNFLTFGVFGNGRVKITVEAVGTTFEQETMIYLGMDEEFKSEEACAEIGEDGKYYYSAEFEYDVNDTDINLSAYAVNSSGTGEKYTILSQLSDNENKIVENGKLVLENSAPEVISTEFENDINGVTCKIKLSDIGSGIAKIEYGWDLDRSLCNDAINDLTGNYQGFAGNEYSEEYIELQGDFASKIINEQEITVKLDFADSVWVNGNKHTLYIRVTDNAGNVKEHSINDSIGSDMYAPKITAVNIRKTETDTADIKYLEFGTFSNKEVELVISVDDGENGKDCYSSGIKEVSVSGIRAEKNNDGEYIVRV